MPSPQGVRSSTDCKKYLKYSSRNQHSMSQTLVTKIDTQIPPGAKASKCCKHEVRHVCATKGKSRSAHWCVLPPCAGLCLRGTRAMSRAELSMLHRNWEGWRKGRGVGIPWWGWVGRGQDWVGMSKADLSLCRPSGDATTLPQRMKQAFLGMVLQQSLYLL